VPTSAALIVAVAHLAFGDRIGFPAFVPSDPIVPGAIGIALQKLGSATPWITATLATLNLAVVIQEFWRGVASRRKGKSESIPVALVALVSKARRRYGGYTVHFGITLMFIGFLGQAWGVNHEQSLRPGSTMTVDRYTIRYDGPRSEVDPNKRMNYADLTVLRAGSDTELGKLSPAKFVYKKKPDMPTTEIAVLHSIRDDLYVVLGSVSQDKTASLQVHINPLVSWIWLGVLFLIFGASVSLWPDVPVAQLSPWAKLRLATSSLVALALALLLASMPARAFAADSTSTFNVALPPSASSSNCDSPASSLAPGAAPLCVPEAQ
jgi:cytochrome c-type biogenesis protein CcmF